MLQISTDFCPTIRKTQIMSENFLKYHWEEKFNMVWRSLPAVPFFYAVCSCQAHWCSKRCRIQMSTYTDAIKHLRIASLCETIMSCIDKKAYTSQSINKANQQRQKVAYRPKRHPALEKLFAIYSDTLLQVCEADAFHIGSRDSLHQWSDEHLLACVSQNSKLGVLHGVFCVINKSTQPFHVAIMIAMKCMVLRVGKLRLCKPSLMFSGNTPSNPSFGHLGAQ